MSDEREAHDDALGEILDTLETIFEAEKRLRDLGVVNLNKSLDAEYGEWIVTQVEGGERAPRGDQPDWDVRVGDVKIQVKTDRKASNNKKKGHFWISKSTVDRLAPTDLVIFIQLGQARRVEHYYKVPVGDIHSGKFPPRGNPGQEWYSLPSDRLENGGYARPCPPFDGPISGRKQSRGLVQVELPDAAFRALEERIAGDGRSSPADVARELILEALFPVPDEYGEPTEEERDQIIREAFERDDLWGPEEDTYCAELAVSDQGTSSSCPPQAPSRRRSGP